jgi:hypothetical protein
MNTTMTRPTTGERDDRVYAARLLALAYSMGEAVSRHHETASKAGGDA